MCIFKKKKKTATFKDWNNNINNFGFNERASKLEDDLNVDSVDKKKIENNAVSDTKDNVILPKNDIKINK